MSFEFVQTLKRVDESVFHLWLAMGVEFVINIHNEKHRKTQGSYRDDGVPLQTFCKSGRGISHPPPVWIAHGKHNRRKVSYLGVFLYVQTFRFIPMFSRMFSINLLISFFPDINPALSTWFAKMWVQVGLGGGGMSHQPCSVSSCSFEPDMRVKKTLSCKRPLQSIQSHRVFN